MPRFATLNLALNLLYSCQHSCVGQQTAHNTLLTEDCMGARLLIVAGSLLLLSTMASATTRLAISVPEPSSLAMAGMGAIGLAGAIWRKIRQ